MALKEDYKNSDGLSLVRLKYKKIKRYLKFWYFRRTFGNKFTFNTTEAKNDLDDIYKIRFNVYCLERGYIDKNKYPDGKESDEYDKHSIHFILRDKNSEIAASVRLIINSEVGFPIEKHFKLNIDITQKNKNKIAEISRLVVAKKYRKKFLMLSLMKGIYAVVKDMGITHVYSVLDDSLEVILLKIGLPFKKIGKPTLYQGLTTPYIMDFSEIKDSLRNVNSSLQEYITESNIEYNNNSYTIH